MSDASNLKRVRSLVEPIIADLKLDLYDLEFRGGTLRVTIDTPAGSPGGIDLEAIALATRLIGREFDHHDPLPGHYTLEVTSPGLERTLRIPAHYQREIGKTIAVRLRDTVNVGRRVQGVLIAADDKSATIRLEAPAADGLEERTVAFDQIDRARTVFVWGPAPKPGKSAAVDKPKKAAPKKAAAATSTTSESMTSAEPTSASTKEEAR
ncbi:MAG TPA: ribosome maturation factor RimP [Ilumatobacteraceae bacterium]|nr:ribosome maturation factor RimP [Ilumatobacteraceae bacterium]